MTNEQLRMQMLAGVITEGEYKSMLNENQDVDGLRSHMENAINKINNDENLSDKGKEQRIDNIKFTVYDALDPNTNGGVRPSKDFVFDDNWWNSTYEGASDFAIASAYDDIGRAVRGDSFSGTMDETKDSLNENFVGMAAINNPFASRKKESYEDAFEHFLSERYEVKPNREQDLEEGEEKDEEDLDEGKEVEEPNNY
jgi:hypothetical protein